MATRTKKTAAKAYGVQQQGPNTSHWVRTLDRPKTEAEAKAMAAARRTLNKNPHIKYRAHVYVK